ncbi:YjcZ family sporulation protein [Paenibacillus turpanensis]|nr:YjcZ family sporulation protein [Paenibacillus turpanensis]
MAYAAKGYEAGVGAVWTSTGAILVLFILLVIISQTFAL